MTKEYHCLCCNYRTYQKSHYSKHLKTKKHINGSRNTAVTPSDGSRNSLNGSRKSAEIFDSISDDNVVIQEDFIDNAKHFACKYCHKTFKHRQSMYRHIKMRCDKNEFIEMQKLADLMNKKLEDKTSEVEILQQQIDELKSKLQIQNINNGVNIQGDQNNTTNIQLLNYNNTDYEFLQESDFVRCFMDNNHCVKALIEKVHFNRKKPENMNIYISCLRGKFVMVYRDNEWQIRDRKKQIDDLYETNEIILENWFDEYSEKYPHIIKSFTRYLSNREKDNDLIKNVKDEILLMLYNKRNFKKQFEMLLD